MVECRICNREVAGSNQSLGYFAPRSTHPSTSPGSANKCQLRLGRQRQVGLIPLADETQGVQLKLCYPLTMRAIPEHLRDASCGGAIQIDTFLKLFTRALRFFSPIEHCELVNMAVVCRGVRILKIAIHCQAAPPETYHRHNAKSLQILHPLILTRFYTDSHRCINFMSCSLPFRQKCTWSFKSPHYFFPGVGLRASQS